MKWRHRVGNKLNVLLEETTKVALETKVLKSTALNHVNVDTMVQEKAIAFPTYARLYQKMRIPRVRDQADVSKNTTNTEKTIITDSKTSNGLIKIFA